ncbi:MAG TPA: hypothetical protein VE967_11715 [Gemmatimonadaceae bacterium]|nr:hypothetical protein [Gemmatimonadaceae bacterium]
MRLTSLLVTSASLALLTTSAYAQGGAPPAKQPPAKAPAPAPTKAPAPKQSTSHATVSIDPGMSKAQVMERFGKPARESSRGEFTYLFYANGKEKQVGTDDVITLQNDKVVDAVLRASYRSYTGKSSSPSAMSSKDAKNKSGTPPLKRG